MKKITTLNKTRSKEAPHNGNARNETKPVFTDLSTKIYV